MIFSGFTLRKKSNNDSTGETIVPGQHSHCIHCHQVNCSKFADNVTACLMVICELCGWRCHECKQSEHTLTCPEKRVTCLNMKYGCPHELKRSKMAAHLSVCPASVVFCSEEWSRYPIHVREQGGPLPLPQEKSYLDCGQLDIGLAMRDQRMLIDSLHAPRKLRNTLRNSLTQKYPAAPFPNYRTSFDSDPAVSEDTSQTISDDDSDATWDLSKPHPGLQECIHSRLFRVTKDTADSLAVALERTSNVLSSTQSLLLGVSEAGDGNNLELKGETYTSDVDFPQVKYLPRPLSAVESNGSTKKSLTSPAQDYLDNSVVNKSIGMNCDEAETNIKKSSMSEEAKKFVDDYARSNISSERCSETNTTSKPILHDIGGTQLHKLMGYQPEKGQEDEIYLHKMLGVNITIEYINKYMSKPSSMYTFICAQNFRRDEYHWHFKNVHLEIHTGLSGWLEKRCPLSYLGCTFSFQNLEPIQPNAVIYHSWLQESFGLRRTALPTKFPSNCNAACNSLSGAKSSLAQFIPESDLNHSAHQYCAQQKSKTCGDSSGITDSSVLASSLINNSDKLDKECDMKLSSLSDQTNVKMCGDCYLHALDKDVSLDCQYCDKLEETSSDGSTKPIIQQSQSNSQEQDINCKTGNFWKVKPTVYTASNWDSKVLFQYDLEVEGENELAGVADIYHSLTNLPFELLRHIARQLDSFSLCNLALTCHLLRDVCCSLLDDRGIVLLNWQKQRSETSGKVSWKVVSKRWMFSTSFEPVKSWRFTNNHPTIGDHLKVCPFNRDIVQHTQPFLLTSLPPDRPYFSREF